MFEYPLALKIHRSKYRDIANMKDANTIHLKQIIGPASLRLALCVLLFSVVLHL